MHDVHARIVAYTIMWCTSSCYFFIAKNAVAVINNASCALFNIDMCCFVIYFNYTIVCSEN